MFGSLLIVQFNVFHTASCGEAETGEVSPYASILQLLASQSSGHLYNIPASHADFPAIIAHHLNISSSKPLISLVSILGSPGSTRPRFVMSGGDLEFFMSVVCEDGAQPQIRLRISRSTDRSRLMEPELSTAYMARLTRPTPAQYALSATSSSVCRVRVTALSDVGDPIIRFAEQQDLTESGQPMLTTEHPNPSEC